MLKLKKSPEIDSAQNGVKFPPKNVLQILHIVENFFDLFQPLFLHKILNKLKGIVQSHNIFRLLF
jgi:hypothetical protein